MKQLIKILLFVFIGLSTAGTVDAQRTNSKPTEPTAVDSQIASLKARREAIQNEIKVQDSKRNAKIAGVSPESLEAINDAQDSICLALRSELVNLTLEIKELSRSRAKVQATSKPDQKPTTPPKKPGKRNNPQKPTRKKN